MQHNSTVPVTFTEKHYDPINLTQQDCETVHIRILLLSSTQYVSNNQWFPLLVIQYQS